MSRSEIELKYGCNPHQTVARICGRNGNFPLDVVNGNPGYINFLDALNSWQLVHEVNAELNLPAAASFKHVSPAGAAVYSPLSESEAKSFFVEGMELSPIGVAYARARGADRMSSFGDWIALSDDVDVPTAKLIKREVSDGIIAPGFEPEALEILKKKKKGNFPIIQIDRDYEPPIMEMREVFGIIFEQKRNHLRINSNAFKNIVTKHKELSDSIIKDMILSQITLKFTQSNSVCLVYNGQVIGVGAGQQSRIHCTRLAVSKAEIWWLRQHPQVLSLPFKKGITRPEKNNGVDQFLRDDLTEPEQRIWKELFTDVPKRLSKFEKKEWLAKLNDVVLGSDAFFPFRDNIDCASRIGTKYVVQPGGSVADEIVAKACDEYKMVMALTGIRLFHH